MSPDICFILLSFYRPVSDAQRRGFGALKRRRSGAEASHNTQQLDRMLISNRG
jgi:hypothetical protein